MKRVLLIAYYFPPQPKAGALRPAYIATHLSEFGWEATVLTRVFPGNADVPCEVIMTPEIGTAPGAYVGAAAVPKKRSARTEHLRDLARSIIHFPDNRVGWLPSAVKRARDLLRSRRFDAVISTAPPITAHFVARLGIGTRPIPWIADYRDLWSGPPRPYFSYFRPGASTRLAIDYWFERWVLRRANRITAPTENHRRALTENFSRLDAILIPNASDLSVWAQIPMSTPCEFRLCYTGKLYPTLRTPDLLFSSVARLRAENDPAGLAARFSFYGEDPTLVAQAATKYGICDLVTIGGEVERPVALRAQRDAAVLVLIANTTGSLDPIENNNPGSKIFEYAGARRPILALGTNGNALAKTIRETGLGHFAYDETTCMSALRCLYADFLSGRYTRDVKTGWDPPTPRLLAQRFAEVLDACSIGRHRG